MKLIKLQLIFISLLTLSLGCNKNKTKGTTINGLVLSASTQLPIPNVKVQLVEEAYGFPFSGATILQTVTTDANGQFHMQSSSSKPLSISISQDNEFLSDYVGYDEIVWYKLDIPKGNNNITLKPAEIGYLSASVQGDGTADSIRLITYHSSINPIGYNPVFFTYYHNHSEAPSSNDRITGNYIVDYYKYLNGVESHHYDTIEIVKGQTTVYELHF